MKINETFEKCLKEVEPSTREEVRKNMEKTRMPKGERYWFIDPNLRIRYSIDTDLFVDDDFFAVGNYFHTKEEAEAMVDKLRRVLNGAWVIDPPETESFTKKVEAVLNGADVIEMPNEKESVSEMKNQNLVLLAEFGWWACYNWLKSKIVK